jgi:hypothetical protein
MDKRRKWIATVLEEALQLGVLQPEEVLYHTTPAVLATDLPPALVAKVLQAGLEKESFSPDLILRTLGAEQIAEHLPLPLIWNCIDEIAEKIIKEYPILHDSHPLLPLAESSIVLPGEVISEEVAEIEVLKEYSQT